MNEVRSCRQGETGEVRISGRSVGIEALAIRRTELLQIDDSMRCSSLLLGNETYMLKKTNCRGRDECKAAAGAEMISELSFPGRNFLLAV